MENVNTDFCLAVDVEPYSGEVVIDKNPGMREPITIGVIEHCVGRTEMEGESPVREESTANDGCFDLEPCVGMEFESAHAVYSYYNEYARRIGFGVTKKFTRKSKKDRTLIAGHYVCSKYGFKPEREKTDKSRRPRPVTRVGCKAMIKAKRKDSGKWEIFDVIKEHNHELSPGNVSFFRSHKKICKPQKNVTRNLHSSGKRKGKAFSVTVKHSGGVDNLSSIGDDRRNLIDREQQKFFPEEDAEAILNHFVHKRALNPAFYYATEVDEHQRLRSAFWVDPRSRTAYTYFGDVVTFDTTCLTKKSGMPFASFVGVNHHGQLVLFGCALLADETKESFVWLFKTWLEAMSAWPPKAIITDQNKAIKFAIMEVFPESHHRFCLWHILERVSEKLNHFCKANLTFVDKLHDCVYNSLTVDEFEMRWDQLIKDFKLGEHTWLQTLYEDRQQWVPAYLKDTFFAGMSTSQQGESVNSFFYSYLSEKTTLNEFLDQYEMTLENLYEKEAQADFETLSIIPSLKTPSPFEKQAASVYTNEIFKKIQLEVLGMSACCISNVQQEGAITVYIVKEWEDLEMLNGKDYKVMWNGSEVRISCICHLFEFKGFLCRHALVALITSGVPKVPSHYILKRWTKEMRNRHVLDDFLIEQACNGDRPKTMDQRYNDLCQRSFRFAEEGSLSEESYNIALYELQRAVQKLLIVNNSNGRLSQPREQFEKVASSPSNHCSTQESWQQMGQEVFEHMGACQPVYHTREFYQ